MKRNRKQNIKLLALILFLLLGIGYASLTATLKINGALEVAKATWDVHFENVEVTQGSVEANPAPTTNNTDTTEMTYTINFTKPGDFFEFTVDIVNDGTIDAMVDVVSNKTYNSTGTTEITLPTYLTSTTTYNDGLPIRQNHLLAKETSEKIKVRVEFKKNITTSDLPSSGDTTVVFKFRGDYKQANEDARQRSEFGGELILESKNSPKTYKGIAYLDPENLKTICTASNSVSTTGTKTGCMKFYIYDDSGSKYKMILDHNTTPMTHTTEEEETQLGIDTAGWKNNPRHITAYEVADITNTTTFDGTSDSVFYLDGIGDKKQTPISHTQGSNIYYWLFDNTSGCASSGCSVEDNTGYVYDEYNTYDIDGYWTSTPSIYHAFSVNSNGSVDFWGITVGENYGIRPVIEVEKTALY